MGTSIHDDVLLLYSNAASHSKKVSTYEQNWLAEKVNAGLWVNLFIGSIA